MGAPELAVVVGVAIPVLAVFWVVRYVSRLRSAQESLRARVEALERTAQRP